MPNPLIGMERKTGPVTDEGKLFASLNFMKDGSRSKLLDKLMQCSVCPLKGYVKPNGELVSRCTFWKPNKTTCEVDRKSFITEIKFMKALEKEGAVEAMKWVAGKQIAAAEQNEFIETVKYGAPGRLTREWTKDAAENLRNVAREESEKPDSVTNVNIINAEDIFGSVEPPEKVDIDNIKRVDKDKQEDSE